MNKLPIESWGNRIEIGTIFKRTHVLIDKPKSSSTKKNVHATIVFMIVNFIVIASLKLTKPNTVRAIVICACPLSNRQINKILAVFFFGGRCVDINCDFGKNGPSFVPFYRSGAVAGECGWAENQRYGFKSPQQQHLPSSSAEQQFYINIFAVHKFSHLYIFILHTGDRSDFRENSHRHQYAINIKHWTRHGFAEQQFNCRQ